MRGVWSKLGRLGSRHTRSFGFTGRRLQLRLDRPNVTVLNVFFVFSSSLLSVVIPILKTPASKEFSAGRSCVISYLASTRTESSLPQMLFPASLRAKGLRSASKGVWNRAIHVMVRSWCGFQSSD